MKLIMALGLWSTSLVLVATTTESSELLSRAMNSDVVKEAISTGDHSAIYFKVVEGALSKLVNHTCSQNEPTTAHVYVQIEHSNTGPTYTEFFLSTTGTPDELVSCGTKRR